MLIYGIPLRTTPLDHKSTQRRCSGRRFSNAVRHSALFWQHSNLFHEDHRVQRLRGDPAQSMITARMPRHSRPDNRFLGLMLSFPRSLQSTSRPMQHIAHAH
jgi:hypothetical protein